MLVYKDLYLELVHKMDEIYFNLNYHLEVHQGALSVLMEKIERHLKNDEFSRTCTQSGYKGRKRRRRRRKRQGDTDLDLEQFENYFTKILKLESAIVELDPATLPCAGSNNTVPCWNGHGMGQYKFIQVCLVKRY